ncbi:hypothetical protein A19Y_4101 [Planktothrix agardhii NIVA-CYA 126/8]|uniref:Uncharacterized protein n=1 Tax=Planktothrix agardhii (strain NIVA-CYA 126/8) TaxID=388467 RepID=A0A073CL18_PLAA1|nr:hypothetical protein A19Y_4101 [Planktothrix agardhii NIVA-CYA 126/8]
MGKYLKKLITNPLPCSLPPSPPCTGGLGGLLRARGVWGAPPCTGGLGGLLRARGVWGAIPYSLFPIPYSLFPIPYSLFPIPCFYE